MTYKYEDVYKSTLDYFNGDDLATNVWITKYCKSELNEEGVTVYYEKTPDDMFHRIAREIARAGMKYDNPLSENEVYELIKDYKYILFAGRPMAGIGVDDAVSISNCFVVGKPGQDSYGTIATIDQEIMQLSKRGGGCVWENTNVIIKDKGIVPIKEVNVGDYILSFNVETHKDEWKVIKDKYYTDVRLEDQIEVKYSNGVRLKTSKKHPILCLGKDGYEYKSFNDGYSIGAFNKTITNREFENSYNDNDDIAWLIGHHIGDGTIGGVNSKNKNRVRILGDNKEVIEKYAEILNKITGSKSVVKESTQKRYKTKVWEYASRTNNNFKFIELIDNQVGLKTYTCFVPKIIKDNDLYVPFIAGLIDADGSIDVKKGRIELSICSKTLIKEISEYLSFKGQPYHVTIKKSKRSNEKEIYRLVIPNRAPIVRHIVKYLVHPNKIDKLNIISNKLHSKVIELTFAEIDKINNFNISNISDKNTYQLFHANRTNCKKRGGKMAIPGIRLCYDLKIFTLDEYNEIISRVSTINIIEDNIQKLNYIDIEVENNNNYYAGEYGFVNIHNCGTDLSDYRPNGAKVHNAARTSSGPVDICATRFSNTIREVGQNGRRGALMLSMDITHPSAEEFIDAKMEDGKITGANISVKLYDDWMKSALGIDCKMDSEKNRLWKKIIHNATTKAEPGVLFWDTILRESPADCYKDFGFKTISTNPCLHPDSLITMSDGIKKKIKDIVVGDKVLSYNFESKRYEDATVLWQGKTKENAKLVKFCNVICTPDHLIYDPKYEDYREAQYVKSLLHSSLNIIEDVVFEELDYVSDVYDINLNINHNFFVDDILVHNCGEIPLAAGDACRLMSLNLYSYVDNPFTSKASFNFEKFINHSKLSIKLMDNMIDLENEKIDRILNKIDNDPEDADTKAVEKKLWERVKYMNNFGRRSGIGFTALGDMLAALGYKYGTPEATEFVEFMQKVMATSVYIGSCDLVQVDGRESFGCFNYELEKNNTFLNRLTYPFVNTLNYNIDGLVEEFKSKWSGGRRNIALLTCAPAGSLSTQSQTTSGLEPVFMISYRRRRKIDKGSGITPDFVDKTGDAFIEFNVVHPKFIEWYRVHRNANTNNLDVEMSFSEAKAFLESLAVDKLNDIIKESPYFGATAMDCDWHERINMQAALQRYVDHSLSVTCNLPKGTSEEVVEDVYKTAWLSGCKGCTIYVDGCRDGVLITKDKDKKCECNKFTETVSPKRPKKLPCQIVRFSNKGTKWIAAVGLYEDKPYEIFTGLAEKLDIPTNAKDIFKTSAKVNFMLSLSSIFLIFS